MKYATAGRCAWRAVYLTTAGGSRLHLGIDPTASVPNIFGAIEPPFRRGQANRRPFAFRVALPVLSWRRAYALRRLGALAIYRLQQRILLGLDGRFGWGSKGASS